MADNCVFCKIINGKIPSTTVYEDKDVKVFLDISQATPGHTLLVPKKHVQDIFEYDDDLAQKVLTKIPMIARAVRNFDPAIQGLNVVNNNGEVAYQSVFHSHIHFIPRYTANEGFSMNFADNTANYNTDQLEEIAARIRTKLEK